jgi:hypothetical protein
VNQDSTWRGRFPRNDIISLLDVNRRYNLAESTAQDLTFGEIIELAGGPEALAGLKMGYPGLLTLIGLWQWRVWICAGAS